MRPAAFSSPPDGKRGSAPRFPIMTMDEHELTPAMGYVFSARWVDPCESLVSIFWKFARANSAAGHVMARLLGPEIDPYEGVAPRADVVDVRRLRHAFDVPPKMLYGSLIQTSKRGRCSDRLRRCHRCMGRGYHSVIHQFDRVDVCPAHHLPLETKCRRCGYEAPFVINVRLLEAPYRCANCRWAYGNKAYSPASHRPMTRAERIAICGKSYRLHFG
jgi:rubredoxin